MRSDNQRAYRRANQLAIADHGQFPELLSQNVGLTLPSLDRPADRYVQVDLKGDPQLSISISGITAVEPAATQPPFAPPPHPAPVQVAPPAQQTVGDTVTLSQAAQVGQLSAQGQSASSIAQSLGLSVTMVNLDLGIVAQVASIPLAAPLAHAAAPAASPAASATPVSKGPIA